MSRFHGHLGNLAVQTLGDIHRSSYSFYVSTSDGFEFKLIHKYERGRLINGRIPCASDNAAAGPRGTKTEPVLGIGPREMGLLYRQQGVRQGLLQGIWQRLSSPDHVIALPRVNEEKVGVRGIPPPAEDSLFRKRD